jgi:gliding motility-associated-like protein
VYVGNVNGTIKVYNFTGIIFNDAPTDITIAGYATKSVYDVSYNEADKLLYASGNGFVTSIDISTTCSGATTSTYLLNVVSSCSEQSATASLSPLPAAGAQVSYTLQASGITISSNSTGVFTNLQPLTAYKIIATINPLCSGVQVVANFTLPTSTIPSIANANITYCQGATATALVATGTNLLWYTAAAGGTGTSTAPIPQTTTAGSTIYYVSQNSTGNCESARVGIMVEIKPSPAAPLVTSPLTLCQGSIALPLTATGTNVQWYSSATSTTGTSIAPIPTTNIIGNSNYYVSQTNTSGCQSTRATITVNITPPLTVNAGLGATIPRGGSIQLNATATAGADYTWSSTISPLNLSNTTILNPLANPAQTITYLLTVKDVIGNCAPVSSSVQVIVLQQGCINVRNAFSPNGDGINDKWFVYDQAFCLAPDGVYVQVYNRYGSKVYENNAYKNTWDGTYNNKPLPDGTYYAVIIFILTDGSKQTIRRDVSIVR